MAPRILAGTKSSAGTTRMCSDTVCVCACGCLCVCVGGGGGGGGPHLPGEGRSGHYCQHSVDGAGMLARP